MSYYSAAVLATNPTAYYRLDEVSGTSATDLTGHGYTATYSGVSAYGQPGAIYQDSDTSAAFTSAGGLFLPYTLRMDTWTSLSLLFWILTAGVWTQVGLTCDGMTTLAYTNGQPATPGAGGSVIIDSLFTCGGIYAAGNLDEVAIWKNTVLSASVVNSLFWVMASLYPSQVIAATGRDGWVQASGRDGRIAASGRDGRVQIGGR